MHHNNSEYADCIHTNITVHLSWLDRFRVLFGKVVRIRMVTFTEHVPGLLVSESSVSVDRVFKRRSRYMTFGEMEARSAD